MKYTLFTSSLVLALLCCSSCSWGKKQAPVEQKGVVQDRQIELNEGGQAVEKLQRKITQGQPGYEEKTRDAIAWSVQEITTQEGFDLLFQEGYPVVVKFYGSYCPPCRRMKPIFEKLAGDFTGKVRFVAIEVQQAGVRTLAQTYANHGVPSFVAFDKNKEYLGTRLGAASEAELSRFISQHCLR
ncbi:MAG: Thioredoxin [candidate division TM6 bacterium GW2011_GWF2_43_17]|nr:MAG: Thioredoxin [candidate division TM6 bacterium GW2011_GWF2_43_17]HAU30558.1 hypothetical protein [Candidatus Dependentiae bacterium]